MKRNINKSDLSRVISVIVERWVGDSLDAAQSDILDGFIKEEVDPLGDRELLDRMVTPGDTLRWFTGYLQTRPSSEIRRFVLSEDIFSACYGP